MSRILDPELDLGHDVVDFVLPGVGADLSDCDREPIHLSGAIQAHGMLLAVRETGMTVEVVSENSRQFLGIDPSSLLGKPLAWVVGAEPMERLGKALADPRASGSAPLVFHLDGVGYDLTWHRIDGLVVVEIEPADATVLTSMSDLFADVRYAMQTMQGVIGVRSLCAAAAEEFSHVTGYDRVMVYQFHPDGHGEVVAENHAPDLEPFLGLHYPASDIPRQARKLYLLNHLRVIADVDYRPAGLLGGPGADDRPSLNLSYSSLRSVSPMHLEYLRNMGVQATLTISLMHGTNLWGMLACHHRTTKLVDPRLRAACRVLGQVFSQQLVLEEDREHLEHRSRLVDIQARLIARMSGAPTLAEALVVGEPSPLALTAAHGAVARIDGQTFSVGSVPAAPGLAALLTVLRADDQPVELVCDDLPLRHPQLAPLLGESAGVLAFPLTAGYEDFVLWFRGEAALSLTWAGDPDKPMVGDPHGQSDATRLGPRESFAAWVQDLRGRCVPWLSAEVAAARDLAAAVPDVLMARARDRLAHLALHDPLTGLPNRALMLQRCAQALAAAGSDGPQVGLLFVDLDRFKQVNDTMGHAAGDVLLGHAASRLLSCVRDRDTVARIGGDEFVVLCGGLADEQLTEVAERIAAAFRTPFRLGQHTAAVTASIGIAAARPGTTPTDLLADADAAMYRAKRSGRDAVMPHTPETAVEPLQREEIETTLRPALDRRELKLYFQPIYSISGAVTGFESLVRWPVDGRGLVALDGFRPVIEAIGMAAPLTDWVLDIGLQALSGWRRAHPELDLDLAMNIGVSQMDTDVLRDSINAALRRYELPARALCLEITETALLANPGVSRTFLTDMGDQGIRLSIDNFGINFTAMSYLTELPVHELKIDPEFVNALTSGRAAATVTAAVVELAHRLGLRVVAGGIESEAQLSILRELNCDLVQGPLLGQPMQADDVEKFLSRDPTG